MDDSNKTLDNKLIDTSEIADVVEDTSINDAIQNTMNSLDSLNELLNNSPVNNSVKPNITGNKEQSYLSNNNDVLINPNVIVDNNLNNNEINGTSENINVFQNNNTNNEIKNNLNNINVNNDSVNGAIENNVDNKDNITQTTVEQKSNHTVAPITPEIKEDIVNNNADAVDESKLLEAFIGKNSEKILTKKFSLPAFFLNSFYMLYRKMFLSSLGVFLIYLIIPNVLVYLLFPSFFVSTMNTTASYSGTVIATDLKNKIYVLLIYVLAYIIFGAIFGLLFNKMYIKFASKKVSKISVEESEHNQKELEIICSLKGGTSMEKVILGIYVQITIILAIIVLSISIISISLYKKVKSNNFKQTDSLYNTSKDSTKSSKFNGRISKDVTANIRDEFYIDVPSVFTNISEDEYELKYKYSNNSSFGTCRFKFYSVSEPAYDKADEMISQMIEFYGQYDDYSINDKIGQTNWSWFSINQDYYYATIKNKKVYMFNYQLYSGVPADCQDYINKTLSSIKPINK